MHTKVHSEEYSTSFYMFMEIAYILNPNYFMDILDFYHSFLRKNNQKTVFSTQKAAPYEAAQTVKKPCWEVSEGPQAL